MSISFPAACESSQVRALLAAAEGEGVDTALLNEILWLTSAHTGLKAFHVACIRLTEVIHNLPAAWGELRNEVAIDSWLPVLEWVIRQGSRLAETVGPEFVRVTNSTGRNPIMGSGVDEFAFYAVLCEPLPANYDPLPYRLLTGHLLLAYAAALRDEDDPDAYHHHGPEHAWKFLPNGVDSAARAVRRLFEPRNSDFLSRLEVSLPPEEFAAALEQHAAGENASLEKDRHNLYRFLQKCWGSRNWRDSDNHRGGGGGGSHQWIGGRVSVIQSRIAEDTDPSGNWGRLEIARFRSVSSRKANAHLRSDLSPDEDESDEEIALGDDYCSETIADPGALARTARAKSRAVARSNQLLNWSYEHLSSEEARLLVENLTKMQEQLLKKKVFETQQRELAEALLLIKVMMATGSDVERAAGTLAISASDAPQDDTIAVYLVSGQPQPQAVWRIPALRPHYKTDLSGSAEQLRPEASHVDYTDPLEAAPLVEKLLEWNGIGSGRGRLFSLNAERLAEEAAVRLKKLDDDEGRITLTKIANTLWQAAHDLTGDAAIASCMTGTPHPLARVRLHYTTIPTSAARTAYARVFESILGRPHSTAGNGQLRDSTGNTSIGARLCPTSEAVRSLFVRLKHEIEATHAPLDRAEFITHHNLVTLHVVLHFAYATTCRAVVTPYLAPSEIDCDRQLATLSDKDDETQHKTRLIWIPRPLLDTMLLYEAHLDSLKAQMPGLPRTFAEAPCFFLDENMKPLAVRPKTLEPRLQPYLNVRANTHRRFLRSELLLRGCNPEVVDAFMGHWHAGEEPFSPYSSFSFASYTRELRIHLEPLLAEIGLDRPIAGRLAR